MRGGEGAAGYASKGFEHIDLDKQLEHLRTELIVLQEETVDLQREAKERAFAVQRRKDELEEKKRILRRRDEQKHDDLSQAVEKFPQELANLRKDLEEYEKELVKEQNVHKQVEQNIDKMEGLKRRTEQMTRALESEMERIDSREATAMEHAAEIAESMQEAEASLARLQNEKLTGGKELVKKLEDLGEDPAFADVDHEREPSHSDTRVKNALNTALQKLPGTKKDNDKEKIKQLSLDIKQREEESLQIRKEVDTLREKVDKTEIELETAKQERVKNLRYGNRSSNEVPRSR